MRRILAYICTALMVTGYTAYAPKALAQLTFKVVSACSAQTYALKTMQYGTIKVNGDICTNATGGGGGGGAVTIASGADVVEGATSDTASTGSVYGALLAIKAAAQDTTPSKITGDVASGVTDPATPVGVGGLAKTSDPTAVADGQRVENTCDVLGKCLSIPVLRGNKFIQQTTITSSASETTIVTAAAANVFADPYQMLFTNTSASNGTCTVKDATSGTTRAVFAVLAGMTGGISVEAGSAWPQAVAANNWTATCTSLASWQITVLYIKTKG